MITNKSPKRHNNQISYNQQFQTKLNNDSPYFKKKMSIKAKRGVEEI